MSTTGRKSIWRKDTDAMSARSNETTDLVNEVRGIEKNLILVE